MKIRQACVAIISALLFTSALNGQINPSPKAKPERVDIGKAIIETPIIKTLAKSAVNRAPSSIRNPDALKFSVELPSTSLLTPKGYQKIETSELSFSQRIKSINANYPTAQPGLVVWHKSVEHARKAARISGKPVLIFYLLGQLDQEYT